MPPDPSDVFGWSGDPQSDRGPGYVLLAKNLHLGPSQVEYSPIVSMEGYNTLFLECHIAVFLSVPDPLFKIYVLASNDKSNWSTVPVGGTAAFLSAAAQGYAWLDHDDIGQISAAWVRLRYETDENVTSLILSAGVNRKRVGA